MTVARRAVGRGPSNKKNGVFWFTQVYRFTPAKQLQALRRLGCGGLRWLWRKPWLGRFLLDAVGRVTSQVTSERPFFLVRGDLVRAQVRSKKAVSKGLVSNQVSTENGSFAN